MSTNTQQYSANWLLALFAVVVCIAPWPLGSNREWSWPVLTVALGLIALTTAARLPLPQIRHGQLVAAAFAFLIGWMLLQAFNLSLNVHATAGDLLKTFMYACVFLITVQLLDSEQRTSRLLNLILMVALAEAFFGGIQQLVFGVPRSHGSFVNPNHFAGYLEASLGFGIGLLIAASSQEKAKGFTLLGLVTGQVARLRLIVVILVIALVMSRSRMGNAAFLISLAVTAGVYVVYTRKINRTMVILLGSIVLIDVLVISQYFGLDRLQERFQQTTTSALATDGRVELAGYNTRIAKEHLLTGFGAGAYESTFQLYRDAPVSKRTSHAENDYFELLIELGVIGCLPLLVILLTGIHAQVVLLKRPGYESGIAFGCLLGTVSLLIHGIADVNLQIPSNAIMFTLLLAVPLAMLNWQSPQP